MTPTPEQTAHQAGRDAHAAGKGWTETPYSGDLNLTREWMFGWLEADWEKNPGFYHLPAKRVEVAHAIAEYEKEAVE